MQIQGPAFVAHQPASMDTGAGAAVDRILANGGGCRQREDDYSKYAMGLGQLPKWMARYAKSHSYICLNGATFNPNLLYEVTYAAANPLVLGVGFAAFRDLASFLRYGTTAPGGGSNPVAGSITKAMTVGASQSASIPPRLHLLWLQ